MRNNVPFVVTSLQENFPQYYHKAMATLSWFNDAIDILAIGKQPDIELSEAIAKVQPIGLITSPFAANAACRIFACGKTEADFLLSVFPDARVSELYFGSAIKNDVPASLFEEAFGVKDFVLVVGRLEMRKNQLMLLHALELSTIPVVFADGGFTYQSDYAQLCRKYRRKGPVYFTGRLSDELLVSAYHACRLHCLPSWYELPGLVSLEAARYGCPVVASSWGCLRDYLHDGCTWCSPEDSRSIHDAVVSAYDNGNRGFATAIAHKFTWEKFGGETIQHYEQVLQEHTNFAPELVGLAEQDRGRLSFETYVNQIALLVEQNKLSEVFAYYTKNRRLVIGNETELLKIDLQLQRLQAML